MLDIREVLVAFVGKPPSARSVHQIDTRIRYRSRTNIKQRKVALFDRRLRLGAPVSDALRLACKLLNHFAVARGVNQSVTTRSVRTINAANDRSHAPRGSVCFRRSASGLHTPEPLRGGAERQSERDYAEHGNDQTRVSYKSAIHSLVGGVKPAMPQMWQRRTPMPNNKTTPDITRSLAPTTRAIE